MDGRGEPVRGCIKTIRVKDKGYEHVVSFSLLFAKVGSYILYVGSIVLYVDCPY